MTAAQYGMDYLFLFLLLLVSGGWLWKKADLAKISCKTCKEFVVSFDQRFEATAKSNYAGGDTSWEEEKLGSYSDSEVRLVEILDVVCGKSDYGCHSLLEKAEEDIERWWFKLRKQADLKSWLCFQHLEVCCQEHTFGPNCEYCPGAPNDTCGGRGKCEGVEEKDGSGTCTCDRGYGGDMCQSCDTLFYEESDEDEEDDKEDREPRELRCKECDRACSKSCEGPGPGDCQECADGYKESDEGVCEDVDECKLDGDTRCKDGSYCFNTPGSFRCNDCDKSCKKTCNGPGPVKCAECAVGYTRNEHGVCKDDDECTEGSTNCKHGTYCENTPGKYTCKACHIACLSDCHGPGSKGCVACKEGYAMSAEEGCEDIDECSDATDPCDSDTETCSNLLGTYVCKCRSGLVKGEEGRCVTEEERDRQREIKKAKKKKKKKKKKKESEAAVSKAESEGEGEGGGKEVKEEEGKKGMEKPGEEKIEVEGEGEEGQGKIGVEEKEVDGAGARESVGADELRTEMLENESVQQPEVIGRGGATEGDQVIQTTEGKDSQKVLREEL